MEEDIVRVLRILEYEGPRGWVEESLQRRGVKGEYKVNSHSIIREALLGEFSVILRKGEEIAFEYFCYTCGELRLSFDRTLETCRNCGSPSIVTGTPGSLDKEALKEKFKKRGGEFK